MLAYLPIPTDKNSISFTFYAKLTFHLAFQSSQFFNINAPGQQSISNRAYNHSPSPTTDAFLATSNQGMSSSIVYCKTNIHTYLVEGCVKTNKCGTYQRKVAKDLERIQCMALELPQCKHCQGFSPPPPAAISFSQYLITADNEATIKTFTT